MIKITLQAPRGAEAATPSPAAHTSGEIRQAQSLIISEITEAALATPTAEAANAQLVLIIFQGHGCIVNHRSTPLGAQSRAGLGEGLVPSSGPQGAPRVLCDGTNWGNHLRASWSSALGRPLDAGAGPLRVGRTVTGGEEGLGCIQAPYLLAV